MSGTGTGFGSSLVKGEGDWLVVLSCFTRVTPHPVDSRLRGNDGEGRGNDGERRGNDDVVGLSCSPSPLIPLPSRERGILSVVLSCCCPSLWILP